MSRNVLARARGAGLVPNFRQQLSVLVRGVRVFLDLEAGLSRVGAVPGSRPTEDQRRSMAGQNRVSRAQDGSRAGDAAGRIKPENVVWIFGDGRVGSTWLMRMIEDLEAQTLWREPMVGLLFGYLYYVWSDDKRHETRHFILGRDRESWLRSIRNFVLDEAGARFPALGGGEYLIIKEPNGSIGAPLLMEALPESRMILLVRDPRDVVASSIDAHREGSWHYERRNMQNSMVDEHPVSFVEMRANKYLWHMGNSKLAYDAHRGPKAIIKYEDLRSETLGTMRRIYSELGIEVDPDELARAVRKHAWENVPDEEKGEGKFYRKAKPGGWREDLTPEQVEVVERITAPLLKEFYSYQGEAGSLAEALASSRQQMQILYGP